VITFNEVSKIFEGTAGNTQHQSLAIETVGLLAKREGGLRSLVQDFEQNGLGHIIASWVGTGPSLAISEDQVNRVLGSQCLSDLAKRAGIAPEKVAGYLTKSLPNLVDALTPDGKIGSGGDLRSRSREILAAFIPKQPAS
jgi:uncharacterized protein YidB (DUF937 family)